MAKPSQVKLRRFRAAVLRRIAEVGEVRAKKWIPSRTLEKALRIKQAVTRPGRGAQLFIPHYWALYAHDGRRGFTAIGPRKFLVFFADPRNDPRTDGGRDYPVRVSQVKKLTKAQFDKGMRINRQREKQGEPPFSYMKVLKSVGPARGTPFFEMLNTVAPSLQFEAHRFVGSMFSEFMQREVIVNEKKTAKVKMPKFRRIR